MAKKKVALVLSGGASLGSYIAGALDELLRAFTAASDRYEIDIITGASAGATTAAMIAHGLLYRGGATALHDIWVEKVDITDLLAPDIPNDELLALLNARRLMEVAQEAIRWPHPQDPGTLAPFCSPNLVVAMTLSNTTPLPYISRVHLPAAGREEIFAQHRNTEQESFYLGTDVAPTDPIWQRIGEVARASAAIPLVFPPVRLSRRVGEGFDDSHYIQKPSFPGEAQFWYFDGGMFNNLPVDLAWYHARKRGDDPQDRLIVVVNPWRPDATSPDLRPAHPGLLKTLTAFLEAMRHESSALQFTQEVLLPSTPQGPDVGPGAGATTRALPGVDGPPVELLANFALVMPKADDPRLRGNHLMSLAAFLDQRFREYDFRRGAADARLVATENLGITYDARRPAGYYEPDQNPALAPDIPTYESLDGITSTYDIHRTVRQVFEAALDGRIDALIRRWDAPGPDLLTDPLVAGFVKQLIRGHLPAAWL